MLKSDLHADTYKNAIYGALETIVLKAVKICQGPVSQIDWNAKIASHLSNIL